LEDAGLSSMPTGSGIRTPLQPCGVNNVFPDYSLVVTEKTIESRDEQAGFTRETRNIRDRFIQDY
jgi:hypothetical protein